MKNRYILTETINNTYNAGIKAPDDINKILSNAGFQSLTLKVKRVKVPILKYLFYFIYGLKDIWRLMHTTAPNSTVVVSVPINSYPFYMLDIYILVLKAAKKCKIVAFVHDITHLRFKDGTERHELWLYKNLDKLIVHNIQMKKYLIGKGITPEKMEILEIFDYLSDETVKKTLTRIWSTSECEICIAGNLTYEKTQYIYSLNKVRGNIKYNLYGNGYTGKSNGNVSYKGVYSPEELPNKLQGNFGLIWDGESTNTCSGIYGEYMKYNNPHKLSLYLASGLPVIVWTQSAIKDFVLENNVGFAVDSLDEIADKVALISEEKYQEYLNSANEIGNRLRKGYYTLQAIDKCMC